MRSIIEEIANAEAQAEEIRQAAASFAREQIANANDESEQALAKLDAGERASMAEALEQAQAEGDRIAREMRGEMEAEAEETCRRAEQKLAQAVDYLIGKVQQTA